MRDTQYGGKIAEAGDVVRCKGMSVRIEAIYNQEYYKGEGFGIEFVDSMGNYRYWKQWCDGGELIPVNKEVIL